jgi:hypothetical protein
MRYVIAGFGKFGRLAMERIISSFKGVQVTVLEKDHNRIQSDLLEKASAVEVDAVSYIASQNNLREDDIIVPAVPFNLAAAVLASFRTGFSPAEIPLAHMTDLPNLFSIDRFNVVASRADFLCPDDCPEGELCTVTGAAREQLYLEIERLSLSGFTVLVVRSSQILPGVGGYELKKIRELISSVGIGKYIIATSCKCHAILTGLISGKPLEGIPSRGLRRLNPELE